jgi:hypothetical protein
MIKLKSGKVVQLNDNFDVFFQKIMAEVIAEATLYTDQQITKGDNPDSYNKILLKELMDNSIYVTHQIFDLAKVNKNLSKFLVTGFLFNSLVLSIPDLSEVHNQNDSSERTIH